MQYILYISLIIANIIKKNSRILTIALLLLMWLLYAGNSDNPDYTNYLCRYENVLDKKIVLNTEFGFNLFMGLFSKCGLSYQFFKAVYSLVGLLLISSTIFRYTENVGLPIALYFIFPFLFDIVQLRNFMAMAIFVFAFRYLVEDRRYNTLKYIVAIFVASTFHTVALFYFIFVLAKYMSKSSILCLMLFVVPIGCILSYTEIFAKFIGFFTARDKINDWFQSRAHIGIILMWGLLLLNVFIIYLVYNTIKDNYDNPSKNKMAFKSKYIKNDCSAKEISECCNFTSDMDFAEMLMKISLFTLLVAVLLIYHQDFFRIYRNILPLYYLLVSIGLHKGFNNRVERVQYLTVNLLYVFGLAIYYMFANVARDTVFFAIMENNILFS